MKNSRDGKSYSTNLAYTPPEYLRNGEFPPFHMSCFKVTLPSLSVSSQCYSDTFGSCLAFIIFMLFYANNVCDECGFFLRNISRLNKL